MKDLIFYMIGLMIFVMLIHLFWGKDGVCLSVDGQRHCIALQAE